MADQKKLVEKARTEAEAERQKNKMLPKITEERDGLQIREKKAETQITELNAKVLELMRKLAEKNKDIDITNRYIFKLKQRLDM